MKILSRLYSDEAGAASMVRLALAATVSLMAVVLTGCGDPEDSAVDSLKELRYGNTVDDYLMAAEAGDLSAIRLFHEAGMGIDSANSAGDTALMRAAAGGRLELVEILMNAGADPRAVNAKGRTPLMFSAESGRADVCRLLLDRGADFDTKDSEGWTALKLAAFNGRADVVELFAGKVSNEILDQVLLVAAFHGDAAVIDQLLNFGAYINTRSPEGHTPLMIAAQAGNLDAVKLLLQNRANPYAIDESEQTAANLAEAAGHLDVSELLHDPSSVMELAESGGETEGALMEADPALAEAAITEALEALSGGESEVSAREMALAVSGGTSLLAAKEADSQRLASINGRVLGAENSVPEVGGAVTGDPVPAPETDQVISTLKMKDYREEPLPVMLKGVEADSGVARVRVLSGRASEPVEVREGEVIPGTHLKVASMDAKFISSKMGKGELVDASSMLVEDTVSGSKHLLVKDVPGRSSETYATLVLPGSPFEYVVKSGDVFRAVSPGDVEQDYEVLDVRPTQVVIRNVGTEEVMTVNRDGIAMR